MKRKIISILIAWMLFIGVDFLFHASILTTMWEADNTSVKSLEDLAILIPVGYTSFLLLTILVGYIFFRIFKVKPELKDVLKFGLTFGVLFSLSNLLGLFSFVSIPLDHLILINLVYLIEIVVVSLSLYYCMFSEKLSKIVWSAILLFFLLLISGIVIQNVI